jgi:integrase/recombinase XerD
VTGYGVRLGTGRLTVAEPGVRYDLIRDLRHMQARAAPDLADWLVHLELENKADRTIYSYSRYAAELLRAHPDKPLDEFTHTDINDALRRTPKDSRHIVRSVFNRWFEWAVFDQRITVSPMARVPRMPQPRRRPKDIFSDEEIALLEDLPAPDGPLFAILFGTGIRRGEARRLRRDHINLNRARLIVYHGKGDKDRIIPLPATVLAAVSDLDLLERLEREDHLWYSRRGPHRYRRDPISDSTFDRWYRLGIQQAGVRCLNPHQTRHSYHWRMRQAGFDLEERQALMGHESPATTQRQYGRIDIEELARKVAAL